MKDMPGMQHEEDSQSQPHSDMVTSNLFCVSFHILSDAGFACIRAS